MAVAAAGPEAARKEVTEMDKFDELATGSAYAVLYPA